MSSNLPPGVTDSMIPGNRPEDARDECWINAKETELQETIDEFTKRLQQDFLWAESEDGMEFDRDVLAAQLARMIEDLELDGRVYRIMTKWRDEDGQGN